MLSLLKLVKDMLRNNRIMDDCMILAFFVLIVFESAFIAQPLNMNSSASPSKKKITVDLKKLKFSFTDIRL